MNINFNHTNNVSAFRHFSNGNLVLNDKPAERKSTGSTFQINRERAGLRRNSARSQHREREAALQDMEDASINRIRGQMAQVVNSNAELHELRSTVYQTGQRIDSRLRNLNSLVSSSNEDDESRENRINRLIDQGLLQTGFTQGDYNMLMMELRDEISHLTNEREEIEIDLSILYEEIENKNLYYKGYFKYEVPFTNTQLPCLRYIQRFLRTIRKEGRPQTGYGSNPFQFAKAS